MNTEINTAFDPLRPWSLEEADNVSRVTETLHPCRISVLGGSWVSLHKLGNREYMIVQSEPTGAVRRYGVLDYTGYSDAFDHFTQYRADDAGYPIAMLESIERWGYYDSDSQLRLAGQGFDRDADYTDDYSDF